MKAKSKEAKKPAAPKKEKPAKRKVQAVARSAAGTVQAVQTSGILPADLQDLGPEGVDLEQNPNATPEDEAAADEAEDLADPNHTEVEETEATVVDGLDQITQEVCRHYGHNFLAFSERFTRDGFPMDRRGQPVRVARMYHVVNLCLDIIPADMKKDELVARKATIEALGYSYTYWRQDEVKQDAATLWARVKPAPKDKAIKPAEPNRPALHGDVRVLA